MTQPDVRLRGLLPAWKRRHLRNYQSPMTVAEVSFNGIGSGVERLVHLMRRVAVVADDVDRARAGARQVQGPRPVRERFLVMEAETRPGGLRELEGDEVALPVAEVVTAR